METSLPTERQYNWLERSQIFLHANPTVAPLVVLMLALAMFSLVAGPNFMTAFNMSLILQQVTVIGLLAVAQTLVIITAGIDLSVAAIMVLSAVVMGRFGVLYGVPAPLALLAGMVIGSLSGLFNGLCVTRLKLPPFIVTLGSWSIFFALTMWYSEAQSIRSQDIDATMPSLKFFGWHYDVFGLQLTTGALLLLLTFGGFWYILNWTAWGRAVYAVGDDRDAAELAGIRVNRVLLSVYILAGLICAITGWVAVGRIGSVSPQSFYQGNLDAITAVVIGGCSLFGGRGSILGTLVGALIVGVFRSGLKIAGVDVIWQEFTVGVLIIIAVTLDQWIRKVSK